MNIDLVKAYFETTLKSTILLARFILDEIWMPECVLKMVLNCFEQWKDFADSRDFCL